MLTYEDFVPLAGQDFTPVSIDGSEPLILSEVVPGPPASAGYPRQPFSLLFHRNGPPVEQCIWRLAHATLGEIEIFLVPVARNGDTVTYEAIFT